MSIYDEIGIPCVINAAGSMTYLGGSLMHPEVLEAMRSAAGAYVLIEDLLQWASGEISAHTGAEAGLVTTGTTGGLILATAACLTGVDRQRMRQLPDTRGFKAEVVMQKQHRISFDHAARIAGAQIVDVAAAVTVAVVELVERTRILEIAHPVAIGVTRRVGARADVLCVANAIEIAVLLDHGHAEHERGAARRAGGQTVIRGHRADQRAADSCALRLVRRTGGHLVVVDGPDRGEGERVVVRTDV